MAIALSFHDRCPLESQECVDLHIRAASLLLAANLITKNFEREQSLVRVISAFARVILGDDLTLGFSAYREEDCHESQHGEGSCSSLQAKYGWCSGDFAYSYHNR